MQFIKINSISRPLLITAAMVMGGCATVDPEAVRQEAKVIAKDSLPPAPTTWAMVQDQVGDVEVGWMAQFKDPTLSALVAEAQVNSRNLQATAANVERSWALAKQAGAALTPNLGLAAGTQSNGTASSSTAGSTNLSVGVQASWEIDVWGRVRSGRNAAVDSAEAAEADLKFAQYSVAAGVARAYFMAIEAGLQASMTSETLTDLTEILRITQVKYDNGAAGAQELALAKSDLASANDAVAASAGSRRDAVRALELLLGRYPAAELEVRTDLPAPPPPPPAGLPSEILERRPDLIAAERRIAASLNKTNQAKVAKLPSISLSGTLGGASNSLSSLLNPANLAWTAASSLLAPLVDGGAADAGVELANADQKAAVAAYSEAALKAFGEVEQSLDQGVVLVQRDKSLTEAEAESNEALRLAKLRFKEGETDLLDVLSIQQRVTNARRNQLAIERARLDQFINLNMALGGDYLGGS